MDFQLDALDTVTLAEEGVKVPLKTLGGEPLLNGLKEPCGLILYGSDSEVYRKAARASARNRIERTTKNTGDSVTDEQLDAAEADGLNLIVACTKGWFGILNSKGEAIKFSPDGARELYRRYPPAKEQADAAIVNRALFTKASSGA
jgi:hypothetical protein